MAKLKTINTTDITQIWLREEAQIIPHLELKWGHNYRYCFIDYVKAFDCVDYNKPWKILEEMGRCWEILKAGGDGDDRGWDGWMASLTWWTCVWINSGSWWWTGRPGVIHGVTKSQTQLNDWTELNWGSVSVCVCLIIQTIFNIIARFVVFPPGLHITKHLIYVKEEIYPFCFCYI